MARIHAADPASSESDERTEYTGSSGAFQGIVIGIGRRYPDALAGALHDHVAVGFPTRSRYVEGGLLGELHGRCVRCAGLAATFDVYAESLTDLSYPGLNLAVSSPDAVSLIRRFHRLEMLAPRIATTRLVGCDGSSIVIEQQRHLEEHARSADYGAGYWGFLASLLRAGGYRNVVLESADGERPLRIFENDGALEAAMPKLGLIQVARLSWSHVEPVSPWNLVPVKTLGEHRLVGQIVRTVHEAIDDVEALPMLDALSATNNKSTRSVQRRLRAAWTSVRDIRCAVRLQRATRLLIQRRIPLCEIAGLAGYADGPHLAREFKRLVGLTPKQYRELSRL